MIKLYDTDSYISEFEACVTECIKTKGGYKVILDQTAFFPEAGGQTCDTGYINGKEVLYVGEENDIVYHIVKEEMKVGSSLQCSIDFKSRYRKMQHHSAEHILSGIVNSVFKYDNVGFHLNDKEVTIDYNGKFTDDDIKKLEFLANEVVQKNIKVKAYYPDEEELKSLNYRSKLDLTQNIRIVIFPGIDICACCAPHVKNTGEIGLIKITDSASYKGGTRMHMICAADALCDYQKKQQSCADISSLLSVQRNDIYTAVTKLCEEIKDLKLSLAVKSNAIMKLKAEKIEYTDGNICLFVDKNEIANISEFADMIKNKSGGITVVCTKNKDNYNYVICGDADIVQINKALCGRGGGRNEMFCGSFAASKRDIEKYFLE